MKRILTIQDLSCVGKCSLTVALPIISAAGIETAVLPTAVLSNHTAFKNGFTFHDLTGELSGISRQLQKEGISFDAMYTGYLGSAEQIDLVLQVFEDFRQEDSFYLVDPVMADFGKLYAGFSDDFVPEMAKLCAKADLIVPNLTEACLLLGEPYIEKGYSEEYIKTILKQLTELGPKEAALTGVSFEEGQVGTACYNRETDTYFAYYNKQLPVTYHGTGDIFASSLFGAKLSGFSTEEALKIAVDFVCACIECTEADPDHNWYGVNFETALPEYLKLLGNG